MKTFAKVALAILPGAFVAVSADNSDPIVLIHGLAGSAEGWEYRDVIEAEGVVTHAVNVGKFTSNWHRAAEAYAQIKGTVVDYGACHTAEYGHARYGKDYTGIGLYPEWDEDHRVHVWGHSLGATTATHLERMLRQGSGCAEDTSPLYTGGHNWLTSVSTFSGVLSGTTAVEILDEFGLLDVIKQIIIFVAGALDTTPLEMLIDLDFTEWGLEREDGEDFDDFWDRVEESGFLLPSNKDISTYDLSVAGARQNNALGPMEYGDTYYFAFATERTHEDPDCFLFFFNCQYEEDPDFSMTFILHPTADILGENWDAIYRKNDGIVNWVNQLCPVVEDSDRDRCQEFNGNNWPIGQWVYQDVPYLDHLQIMSKDDSNDEGNYGESAKKLFVDHARRTKAL